MQEFVFNDLKRDSTISIKLKSFRVLSRNKPIGTATFNLEELEDGVPKKMIRQMEAGGSIVAIFCRLAFSPPNTPIPGRVIHERLPSLRIVLEKNVYYPGDVVRGHIRYFERYRKPLMIHLLFEGMSKVYFTDGSDDPTYNNTYPHFSHNSVLFGTRRGMQKVKVGPQFFFQAAFEFRLPTNIPPTLHCILPKVYDTKLSVQYRAVAFIQRANYHTKKEIAEFKVMPSYSPPLAGFCHSSASKLIRDNDVILKIEGLRYVTAGTTPYELKVSIDNTNGTVPVESLTIKLKVAIYYYAEKNSRLAVQTLWRFNLPVNAATRAALTGTGTESSGFLSIVPVPVGKKTEGTLKMNFSADVAPSLNPTNSPLIQTQLYLTASIKKVMNSSKCFKAVAAIPVVRCEIGEAPDLTNASPNVLQCRAYGVPQDNIETPCFVPPHSLSGKHVAASLSMQHPLPFNFKEYGEPIVPEVFTGYDDRFMTTPLYHLKPADWTFGTTPSWVPKPWPADLPAYLRFKIEDAKPTQSQQIFEETSSSSSSSDSSDTDASSEVEEEPLKFVFKLRGPE